MDIGTPARTPAAALQDSAAASARQSSTNPGPLHNVLKWLRARFEESDARRATPVALESGADRRAYLARALQRTTLELQAALQENAAAKRHRFRLMRALYAAEARARASDWRAEHDALTGLPNRAALMRTLPSMLGEALGAQRPLALLFIDLDAFKHVNDRLGHAAGDRILVLFARRLRGFLRSGDAAFRFDGDEFVVLLSPDRDTDHALETLQRLRARLECPYRIGGEGHRITASIGIARWPGDATATKALLHVADLSMYRDKAGRRSPVCA